MKSKPEQVAPKPDNKMNAASAMLLEARSRIGFTQKEVADQLFLMPSFIRYIDEGRFDKIPKPAFIKGYLRTYARVVELSGDEVVARFEESQQATQDDVEIKDVTEEQLGSSSYTGPVFLTGVIGLVGVLVVILLVWLFSDSEETPVIVDSPPTAALSNSETESVEVEVLALPSRTLPSNLVGETTENKGAGMRGVSVTSSSLTAPGTADKLKPATEATSEADRAIDEDEEMSATFSSVVASPQEVAESQVDKKVTVGQSAMSSGGIVHGRVTEAGQEIITISAGGDDELYFEFDDDCWLEVRDANGVAIYGDLNRGGDVIRMTGVAPFSILLGKAPAVSLKFNGVTVDVSRHTAADNTAKLRLGQ